jgi:hypothetical protein
MTCIDGEARTASMMSPMCRYASGLMMARVCSFCVDRARAVASSAKRTMANCRPRMFTRAPTKSDDSDTLSSRVRCCRCACEPELSLRELRRVSSRDTTHLEEDAPLLDIDKLDAAVSREEEHVVLADEGGLSVVPLAHKGISLKLQGEGQVRVRHNTVERAQANECAPQGPTWLQRTHRTADRRAQSSSRGCRQHDWLSPTTRAVAMDTAGH